MSKSLGDYSIEKSSSSDVNNIKWSKKQSIDTGNPKNKKKTIKKISPLNIIPNTKAKNVTSPIEKIFKVEDNVDTKKLKKKTTDKRFQNSSASNCKIEQGFRRPGR